MATKALWHENLATHNARDYRRLLQRLLGDDYTTTPGDAAGAVFRFGDLAVTERGAGVNRSVDVAEGGIYVQGSQDGDQGGYFVYVDGTTNVPLDAADATNPRIDLIGVVITDTEYTPGTNTATVTFTKGTAAAVPAEPAVAANWVTLARVDIPANDTTISNAQITDRRRFAGALGGIIRAQTSLTHPTGALGRALYRASDDEVLFYNSAGQWRRPWRMPWGAVAVAEKTSMQTSIGTGNVDVTGLSVTFTAVANRYYKITSFIRITVGTGGANFVYKLRNGSSADIDTLFTTTGLTTASTQHKIGGVTYVTFSAGSQTVKGTVNFSGNANNEAGGASATDRAVLIVEDIGPSGAAT